jgi:hypothetical protein
MTQEMEQKYEVIAETTNFLSWKGEDVDGEICYHLEIGNAMLTFYTEEWIEMLDLIKQIIKDAEQTK